MENNETGNASTADAEDSQTAVNSLILDYYKKFGRKRDLEQFFSLSTAQGEVRDPSGLFWRRMKSQNDSSDSGERKSESSTELCRISIRCSMPESSDSRAETPKVKSDSESPPIIMEDAASRHSDEESVKSDDNQSQKSYDVILDTSINKPLSPSSSITSQRKLEWDSLADVGYGNESDRKNSASSLSTLERLALKQQYSNNDTDQGTDLGLPTAHSTFLDQVDSRSKGKHRMLKKTTTFHNKDTDIVELNMPQGDHPAINVNLTKHISFNVEKDGVTIENVKKDINVSPEKVSVQTEVTPQIKYDKEIQTSLTKSKEKPCSAEANVPPVYVQRVPVLINLNSIKKRSRKKKLRNVRRKVRGKKKGADKENFPIHEKSVDQVSEAESFEYMPGHIYNQNQMQQNKPKVSSLAGNKSSLESSGVLTTDSSKGSKHSFTKDLEKSIDLLKVALQRHYDDSNIRKKLIKEVVLRLIKSKYRDDDSTAEFLSGLSFRSKVLGDSHTTTSTSDGNQTGDKTKSIPKKSILRLDKFNSRVPSTSQSAPNLPSVSNSEKLVVSNLVKVISSSNTESDVSSKGRNSSETGFAKTSSEELYQKYLEAFKKEEAYKRLLRDKENFLRQKLVNSETVLTRHDLKTNTKLQDLMKDLTRNNYDDGSGDASKLEGGSNSNINDFEAFDIVKKPRSHSVFTLSSGNSDGCKKINLKKKLQYEIKESKAGSSPLDRQCHCQLHSNIKVDVVDSSVQVNLRRCDTSSPESQKGEEPANCGASPRKHTKAHDTSDIKYVCLCSEHGLASRDLPANMFLYKCSRLDNKGVHLEINPPNFTPICNANDICQPSTSKGEGSCFKLPELPCSQAENSDVRSSTSSSRCSESKKKTGNKNKCEKNKADSKNKQNVVYEATRCLQTEISINPKLSDPSLTDINIVNDSVKLIDENCRQISKPGSSSCFSDNSGTANLFKDTKSKEVGIICSLPFTMSTLDKEVQSNIEINNIESHPLMKIESGTENFAIPIQGTNMTLMVNFGTTTSKPRVVVEQKNIDKTVSQASGTDRVENIENSTCVAVECSKGVQSEDNEKRNTYPRKRNVQIQEKNVRSNSDPSKLEKAVLAQIDDIIEEAKVKQSNTQIATTGKVQKDSILRKGCGAPQDIGLDKTNDIHIDCKNEKCCSEHSSKCGVCNTNKVSIKKEVIKPKETINTCGNMKSNTHPRKVQINEAKSLDRSNTDPTRIEKAVSLNDSILKKGCGIPQRDVGNDCQNDACCSGQSSKCGICSRKPKEGWKTLQGELPPVGTQKVCEVGTDCQDETCCSGQFSKCGVCTRKNQEGYKTTQGDKIGSENTCDVGTDCQDITCCSGLVTKCGVCNKKAKGNNTPRGDNISSGKGCDADNVCQDITCCYGQTTKCGVCSKKSEKDTLRSDNITSRKGCDTDTVCEDKTCCSGLLSKCDVCNKIAREGSNIREGDNVGSGKGCDTDTVCQDITCCFGQTSKCGVCKQKAKEGSNTPRGVNITSGNRCDTDTVCQDITCCYGQTSKCGVCNKKGKEPSLPFLPRNSPLGDNTNSAKECDIGTVCEDKTCCYGQTSKCGVCNKKNKEGSNTPRGDNSSSVKGCDTGTVCEDKTCCSGLTSKCGVCNKIAREGSNIRQGANIDSGKGCDTDNVCQDNTCCSGQSSKCGVCRSRSNNKNSKMDEELKSNGSCSKQSSKCSSTKEPDDCCALSSRRSCSESSNDPILDIIKDITTRYSKKDIEKNKRKKCFKEIINVLNYLLDTEDGDDKQLKKSDSSSMDGACEIKKTVCSTNTQTTTEVKFKQQKNVCGNIDKKDDKCKTNKNESGHCNQRKLIDKAVQICCRKTKENKDFSTESSEVPRSTDLPTSSESTTCKVLNKIKSECEKYHQKRCKIYGKKCDVSSSTSVNCDHCKRVHHCSCRRHKCKDYRQRVLEKAKKKCVAYNLIIQTSDSMVSEEMPKCCRPLKDIVVKVPKRKQEMPFKEMCTKIESNMPQRPCPRVYRTRSVPNECEVSSDCCDDSKCRGYTVRDYLEANRPDFVERSSDRQNCLKMIGERRDLEQCIPSKFEMVVQQPYMGSMDSCNMYCGGLPHYNTCVNPCMPRQVHMQSEVTRIGEANERAAQRELLSLQLDKQPSLNAVSETELRQFAKQLGFELRQKKLAPKFISEREMKRHSEKIYKSLPEVTQKKEDKKKENVKKTNLLMASMFKKNLQKKTLRGSVNLSNYNTVLKI